MCGITGFFTKGGDTSEPVGKVLVDMCQALYRRGPDSTGFALYRAIPQDVADNKAAIARFKLPMPVLAMGGAVSYPHGRGRGNEPEQSLRRVAVDVRGEVVPDCGHFIPEEAPDLLNARLLAFFD